MKGVYNKKKKIVTNLGEDADKWELSYITNESI